MFPELGLNGSSPSRPPLSLKELKRVYNLTDWGIVLLDDRIKQVYNGFSTLSIVKVLALPFVENISSERALYDQLKKRDAFLTLCGYIRGEPLPTRGTLWNFRRLNKRIFPDIMRKVLISMALCEGKPNLDLPFVRSLPAATPHPKEKPLMFTIGTMAFPVEAWTATNPDLDAIRLKLRSASDFGEYRRLAKQLIRMRKLSGMADDLGLPIQVNTSVGRFCIVKPVWMETRTGQKDFLVGVGPESYSTYSACNVLVIRRRHNKPQILLSRRMSGYGKGAYTAPGGKRQEAESLSECARRELLEETGLRLEKSKPVSWHVTRLPEKPVVHSVGVLAVKYSGEPRTLERGQHDEWKWYDLDNLPAPMFEPSRIALIHYRENRYPNLEWKDVEAEIERSNTDDSQLTLPI